MRNQRMNRKQLVLALFCAGAVLVIASIVLIPVAGIAAGSQFYKVMLLLIALVMLLLGCACLLAAYLHRSTEHHFFRYDAEIGRNIAPAELDFTRVNRRLWMFLRSLFGDDVYPAILQMNVFREEKDSLGENGLLSPLIAYKMLYDLSRYDRDEYWTLFVDGDEQLIEDIAAMLESASDSRMARDLIQCYEFSVETGDIKDIRDFLIGNQQYLSRRMLGYARAHDEEFY